MAFLGGHLYTDVKSEYQVTPSAVVYFRWNHNPVSYIQTNLLPENVPGHPARVVHIDKNKNPQAPFLVKCLSQTLDLRMTLQQLHLLTN